MKRILLSIIMICAGVVASAQNLDALLSTLDKVVMEKDSYTKAKDARIDSYRSSLQGKTGVDLYDIYNDLYNEYSKYEIDSALTYALKEAALAKSINDSERYERSQFNLCNVYIYAGMYPEASAILDRITGFDTDYYYCQFNLNASLYASAIFKDKKDSYLSLVKSYRDTLIRALPASSINTTYLLSEKLNQEGKSSEALSVLSEKYTDSSISVADKAILDYLLAETYRNLKDPEAAKLHYALSAIADLQTPVKEYKSLQELAYLLFQDGDITRAYNYISCAMEDMRGSNARIRAMEFASSFSTISEAYQKAMEEMNSRLERHIIMLIILASLLILFVFIISRQRARLSKVNGELARSNAELKTANENLTELSLRLKETGSIKEEYLYQYMEQASGYLDQLEKYRRNLLLAYRKYGEKGIVKELESPFDVDEEFKKFFSSFDDTFLHLFPTFVQDVNALLKEDQQLVPKAGRKLNTELRILALIRLGVTDSVKIARFLRASISTIYNYRTRFRNAAISERSDFETKVASL